MDILDIKQLIRECLGEDDYVICENLLLKKHQGKLVVVSDETDRKKASGETYRNKDRLKAAGFSWDSRINSWTIDQSQLTKAQESLKKIGQSPTEVFISKLEEIPEFLQNTDNLSKKDELSQKIDGYIDALTTAVDAAASSAEIKKFLEFNSKFHGYSFHNTMLIYLQNNKSTKVAGFKKWEEKFFRRVKKGARAISILAPIKRKYDDGETDKTSVNPTPTTITNPTNPAEDEKRSYLHFVAVSVFDISDTEPIDERGEIPATPEWHGSNEPNEKANELFICAKELADTMGVKVSKDAAMGREQGYSAGDHINISSDVSGVNATATLIHEIAHELLHHKKSSPFYVGDEVRASTEVIELQAESVSFIVIKHYGLPAEHQANYLALWKANKDAIRTNLTSIKKAADFIIDELDKIQDEKVKDKTNVEPAVK